MAKTIVFITQRRSAVFVALMVIAALAGACGFHDGHGLWDGPL